MTACPSVGITAVPLTALLVTQWYRWQRGVPALSFAPSCLRGAQPLCNTCAPMRLYCSTNHWARTTQCGRHGSGLSDDASDNSGGTQQ